MLFLGFSSGLPILLIFSTLSVWLFKAGIDRSTVTLFSWVGFAYAFKYCACSRCSFVCCGWCCFCCRSWSLGTSLSSCLVDLRRIGFVSVHTLETRCRYHCYGQSNIRWTNCCHACWNAQTSVDSTCLILFQ